MPEFQVVIAVDAQGRVSVRCGAPIVPTLGAIEAAKALLYAQLTAPPKAVEPAPAGALRVLNGGHDGGHGRV